MILVTGATGLLGRIIALELVKRGRKVRACKRNGSDLSDVENSYHFYTADAAFYFKQIEWVNIDFNNHLSVYRALKDVTEVYHCAAKVSFDPEDFEEVLETGIISTRSLLRASMYMPVKKFLFVSSAATWDLDKATVESQIRNADEKLRYPAHVLSKYVGEKMVSSAYAQGLNTIIINPAMIIGTGNWHKNNSNLMTDFFVQSRFTFCGGTSCVDVRDVATAAVELMERNLFGERFCIAAENILFKNLAQKIRKTVGLGNPVVCSRNFLKAIKILRFILNFADRRARFLTDENIEFMSERKYYSGKKIMNAIHCSFISAEDAIRFHFGNYLADKKAGTGR